jgi:hypothetical protein
VDQGINKNINKACLELLTVFLNKKEENALLISRPIDRDKSAAKNDRMKGLTKKKSLSG